MNIRTFVLAWACVMATLSSGSAAARDDRIRLSIADAMATADAVAKLNRGIQFFFGDSAYPAVERSVGTFVSNKKTNGFGYSDEKACQRAFLSAMLSFQDRAIRDGGDAVIKVTSYYKSATFSSATEFECGAGATIVGVALRGEVVKLKK